MREAENGRVALEAMERDCHTLILLDLMMPEMDGFEFSDRVRQRPEWRQIPIVVLTATEVSGEERQRLSGYLETIVQKAGDTRESLLHRARDLLDHRGVPRTASPRERRETVDLACRTAHWPNMPTILLVEDNQMSRHALAPPRAPGLYRRAGAGRYSAE